MNHKRLNPLLFLSYRRADSEDITGRIYDRLKQHFGQEAIFFDRNSIHGGNKFPLVIEEALSQCQILLVIIGQKWLTIPDATGKRRLDDPQDWVRKEIEIALERGIIVIPVLVQGAMIPPSEELPPSLRELSDFQGNPVRPDPDFHNDLDRLINTIESKVKKPQSLPKFNLLSGIRGFNLITFGMVIATVGLSWGVIESLSSPYPQLQQFLKSQNWQAADQETARVMLQASGREKEQWIDKAGINRLSCDEILKIDQLWLKASEGKFGFSPQREIWQKATNNEKFGDLVGWRKNGQWLTNQDLQFDLTAPRGHLPSVSRPGRLSGGWLVWELLPIAGRSFEAKANQCWSD